jgi:hypothetical protein
VLFPLFVFSLLFLVLFLIGLSLYLLLLVKTASRIPENPYLYTFLFLLEIIAGGGMVYLLVMYINKIWKYKKNGGK